MPTMLAIVFPTVEKLKIIEMIEKKSPINHEEKEECYEPKYILNLLGFLFFFTFVYTYYTLIIHTLTHYTHNTHNTNSSIYRSYFCNFIGL